MNFVPFCLPFSIEKSMGKKQRNFFKKGMEIECAFKFLVLDHIFKTRFPIILLDIKPPKKIDFKVHFLFPDNEAIFSKGKKNNESKRHSPLHDSAEAEFVTNCNL